MMYENDKLMIPERYKKMSVSELRYEKEKLYGQIKKENKTNISPKTSEHKSVVFHF